MIARAQRFENGGPRPIRRGSVLPLLAVLLFVFLPVMALVVDIGLVTLTRRQMQTAVNVAAVEGLRLRNDVEYPTPYDKRTHVQTIVGRLLSGSGVGPDIGLTGGIDLPGTDFQASRTIDASGSGPYVPSPLELNLNNEVAGDMVSGNWQFNAEDPDHSTHAESNDYNRADFEAVPADQIPTSNAFLVRLRRTSGEAPVDDVSTIGPPIPFLFGRGPYGGPEWLDRRERGSNVRATAIAATAPALTVGVRDAGSERYGAFNVQVDATLFQNSSGPFSIGADETSQVQVFDPPSPGAISVGRVPFAHSPSATRPSELDPIGGYVVLTDELLDVDGSPVRTIVGFARATIASVTSMDIQFDASLRNAVGTNASSHRLRTEASVPGLDYEVLMQRIGQRHAAGELLSAPALRRTIP